jgi:hypothetical protein
MSAPKPPTPPAIPPPPTAAHPPSFGSSAAALAAALEGQRASTAEGKGMDNTILTSPGGLPPPDTGKTSL